MPAFLSKPANVLTLTLVLLVSVILVYVGATTLVRPSSIKVVPPTPAELRQALSLAGLSAKPLAAAGVQQAQVSGIISGARTYLTENGASFDATLSTFREKSLLVESLERTVTTGQASEQDAAALAAARTALASAAAARETAINAVFTAATDGLSQSAVQTLANLRANRAREVPVQYRVSARSEENWLALRDALANDRISARSGDDPDPASHQAVLNANAENAVIAANTGLANLTTINQAWNAAVGQ